VSAPDPAFYAKGLKFSCTGCGDCCRSRNGRPSWVYVTIEERRRLAQHLKIRTSDFTRKYCEKPGGFWHLRNPTSDCVFLDGARCTVYGARPGQCRTYPFWRENMGERAWDVVLRQCEGAGHGKLWTRKEIELRLADEAKRDSSC
jgi:Fe-S-cluster containining protein